ncbi:Lrp/AsnC family transcriptional regulator [Caldimonas brevitalea]|uniref:AsnC family transcriptional regulator n=1 Tax=Caldimonas brevitalea TaxID=413882 RepID=A0A0G3BE53_9BURK|nr:Lrp/AsnC family transcriptional regulator [Caldimonas brevitalea]AKJ27704.1 AsnC family transcriptional regulator [Caldimonas brevitalea]
MTEMHLDALDRRILQVLQQDGRASNVDLSQRVHLSPPQCLRRVRALEERGVIRGYTAQVTRESLGYAVMAYVNLNIDREHFGRVRELEQVLRSFPEIIECHCVSGDHDYLMKVVARDLKSLSQFLTDRLMQVPGVDDVRSMICMEEIKPPAPLPVDV